LVEVVVHRILQLLHKTAVLAVAVLTPIPHQVLVLLDKVIMEEMHLLANTQVREAEALELLEVPLEQAVDLTVDMILAV
jgi:hypothetical protein